MLRSVALLMLIFSFTANAGLDVDPNLFRVLDGPETFSFYSNNDYCSSLRDVYTDLYRQLRSENSRNRRELNRQNRILNRRSRRLSGRLRRFMRSQREQLNRLVLNKDNALEYRIQSEVLQDSLASFFRRSNIRSPFDFSGHPLDRQDGVYQWGRAICRGGYRLDTDGVNCSGSRGQGSIPYQTKIRPTFEVRESGDGELQIVTKVEICQERYEGMNPGDAYYNDQIRKLCHNYEVTEEGTTFRNRSRDYAQTVARFNQIEQFEQARQRQSSRQRHYDHEGRWNWLLRARQFMADNSDAGFVEFYENLIPRPHGESCLQQVQAGSRSGSGTSGPEIERGPSASSRYE